ncbi:MAG: outer membrane protein assembly factor BamB [Proteobacteria bacterium]|nr:outer membrane protein assembly factor BamB [Pseudomonadota bacterium]
MISLTSRLTLLVLLLAALGGCSWFPWSGDDDEPEEVKPNPLPGIQQEVDMEVIWSRKVDDRAVKLRPAVVDGRVFAAAADGNVLAVASDTGRVIWKKQIKDFYSRQELANAFTDDLDIITGGVGAGSDLLVVGAGSGQLVAMNQSDGSLAWMTRTSSEVLSPPQIDGDLVVAQSIDGKVEGFDAVDGSSRWVYTMNIPALTLRGTATPIIVDEIVIAAFSSGRIALLDRERGLAGVDLRVAVAQGTSDLERLVDIDGAMQLDGPRLYAASFQGRIVAIDAGTGRIIWAEEASSINGVGTGFGNVYLAAADSTVVAYNGQNGREVWRVDALLHRDITAPVAIGSYIAFTDFEGYAHLMAQSDGRFVGRRKLDGKGVKSGLVSANSRLYAMGDSGTLIALEVR